TMACSGRRSPDSCLDELPDQTAGPGRHAPAQVLEIELDRTRRVEHEMHVVGELAYRLPLADEIVENLQTAVADALATRALAKARATDLVVDPALDEAKRHTVLLGELPCLSPKRTGAEGCVEHHRTTRLQDDRCPAEDLCVDLICERRVVGSSPRGVVNRRSLAHTQHVFSSAI